MNKLEFSQSKASNRESNSRRRAVLSGLAACSAIVTTTTRAQPSPDASKAAARRYFEQVWAKGDRRAANELFSPQVRVQFHDGQTVSGIEALLEANARWQQNLRNFSVTVRDQIAEGDKVSTNWVATGETNGRPGRRFTISGETMMRFTEGKIVEGSSFWDGVQPMRQIADAQQKGLIRSISAPGVSKPIIEQIAGFEKSLLQDC